MATLPQEENGSGAALPPAAYLDAFQAAPVALLVIRADGLMMVDANPSYLAAVGMPREAVVDRHVFDVFPSSPFEGGSDVADLAALFDVTVTSGAQQIVDAIRYDIPTDDGFEVRWWSVVETPLLDTAGRVEFLLHYTEDISELIRARESAAQSEAARIRSVQRVAALAELALALAAVDSVDELEQIVTRRGLSAIGADGGAMTTATDDGSWRITTTESMGPVYGTVVPRYIPVASVRSAETNSRIVLPDRAACLAFSPEMDEVARLTGRESWVCTPLVVAGEVLGSLSVAWTLPHDPPAEDLEIIDGFAAQCAQSLHRAQVADVRRRDIAQMAALSTALQQALLTPPPSADGVEIVVRYRPAVDAAQVGGDWYDAFVDPSGALTAVIGDVMGHDSAAAATMGQLRGLLRGVAYAASDSVGAASPAAVVHAWERAAHGLGVDRLATAVLARLDPAGDASGARTFHWTNAGHLPPMLVTQDGTVTALDQKADLLLGFDPDAVRHDHSTRVEVGSTVFFYTDGLVERRHESIDRGLDDLGGALAACASASLDTLCDDVLDRLAPHTGEDDVAVIALRVTG